jgi:hypothetical protein
MGGEDHQVTGDVRSKESSERKKSDNVDRTAVVLKTVGSSQSDALIFIN